MAGRIHESLLSATIISKTGAFRLGWQVSSAYDVPSCEVEASIVFGMKPLTMNKWNLMYFKMKLDHQKALSRVWFKSNVSFLQTCVSWLLEEPRRQWRKRLAVNIRMTNDLDGWAEGQMIIVDNLAGGCDGCLNWEGMGTEYEEVWWWWCWW